MVGLLTVDGERAEQWNLRVTKFSEIIYEQQLLQANTAEYWVLHKPVGVVSDTKHPHHKTVLDCLEVPNKQQLHVAGRLDLNTSGLVLLTNNGAWSKAITQASSQLEKVYEVTLDKPIPEQAEAVFAQGIYFGYEDIPTLPARLERLGPTAARLTLTEGRYHQVKRMFGHLGLRVLSLHRSRIGNLVLSDELPCGSYRQLMNEEADTLLSS